MSLLALSTRLWAWLLEFGGLRRLVLLVEALIRWWVGCRRWL